MKTYLLILFIAFTLNLQSQPVINGDISDASYTQIAAFASGQNSLGNADDLGVLKYHCDGSDIYLGVSGEVSSNNNILIFFDFSGYIGRGDNTLGAGAVGVFTNIGGATMDFDVDFALAFNEGEGNTNFYLDACRYGTLGVMSSAFIGNTSDQTGTSVEANLGGTFGGAGNITFAYKNNFAGNANEGVEMKIPLSVFSGVDNSQAFRIFVILTAINGDFSNECIPGDPGGFELGNNPNLSGLGGQDFFTKYAPLVFGISFDCKLDAGPSTGPWVGDMHPSEIPSTPFSHSNNCNWVACGVYPQTDCGYYAYQSLLWNSDPGTYDDAECCPPYGDEGSGQASYGNGVVENTDLIDGVANLTLDFTAFGISNLNRKNWGAPDAGPNGLMADTRTYTGGSGTIKVGGVTKLAVINAMIELDVDYPIPFGPGDKVVGSGHGTIDVVNSDPAWVAKFNNGNNQVQFDYYSFSPTIQNCYGAFVYTLILRSAEVQQNIAAAPVNNVGLLPLNNAKVQFNIASFTPEGTNLQNRSVHARQIIKTPNGTLPEGLNAVAPLYWRLGTTLAEINTAVIFDISGISGITNTNNLRILKRENATGTWAIWGSYTAPGFDGLTSTQIRANSLTSFSEFAIASTTDPLPVELSAFDVKITVKGINLFWKTETEKDNYGFEVYRRKQNAQPHTVFFNWEKIGFVSGSGNSNSPKDYAFLDEVNCAGVYEYQLHQIDNNGTVTLSKSVQIKLEAPVRYTLSQNYPNPFNPETKIRYEIPQSGEVQLVVYDILGNMVKELVSQKQEAGSYEVNFKADSFSSGCYLYKISSGNFVSIKKMLLVK